jgi:HEAT repeat protein
VTPPPVEAVPTNPIPRLPVDDSDPTAALVKRLLKDLKNPTPSYRVVALNSLAEVGPRAKDLAGAGVVVALMDPATSVRVAAHDALGKIDPPVTRHCVTLLVDRQPVNRLQAIRALQSLGPEGRSAVPLLVVIVNEAEVGRGRWGATEQAPAVEALSQIGVDDVDLPDRFVTWMRSRHGDTRIAAILGFPRLKQIGNMTNALNVLCRLTRRDADPNIRLAAVRAIGDFGARAAPAADVLRKATADPDAGIRAEAERSLERIGAR